jgi:acetyltransferase EpsM
MTQSNKLGIIGAGKLYKLWLDAKSEEHDLYDDTIDSLPNIESCDNSKIYIAIGHNPTRETLYNKFKDREFADVISPLASISKLAKLDVGCFISDFCKINYDVKIGKCLVMASNSVIDVGSHIGDFVRISPNVYIGDKVKIGKGCIISAGATILPGVHIGENVYVAAGSLVSHSCGDNLTLAGMPARTVNGNNELHRN